MSVLCTIKIIWLGGLMQVLALNSNTVVVFEYGTGRGWKGFGKEGEELKSATYIVDSLKNVNKRDYKLTIERFENWDH